MGGSCDRILAISSSTVRTWFVDVDAVDVMSSDFWSMNSCFGSFLTSSFLLLNFFVWKSFGWDVSLRWLWWLLLLLEFGPKKIIKTHFVYSVSSLVQTHSKFKR